MRRIAMGLVESRYNSMIGGHWFSRGAMRFFNTRLPQFAYEGPGGTYFVTSEAPTLDTERRYTVREQEQDGAIQTIGSFHSMTRAAAHHYAKGLAAGELAREDVP